MGVRIHNTQAKEMPIQGLEMWKSDPTTVPIVRMLHFLVRYSILNSLPTKMRKFPHNVNKIHPSSKEVKQHTLGKDSLAPSRKL